MSYPPRWSGVHAFCGLKYWVSLKLPIHLLVAAESPHIVDTSLHARAEKSSRRIRKREGARGRDKSKTAEERSQSFS